MNDTRNYNWAFPFIGGILIIIGLLTPASYGSALGITENFWMWGLWSISYIGIGTIVDFTYYAPEVLVPGIICTILLLIGSFKILSKSYNVRMGKANFEKSHESWLGMGILFIVTAIIYIIGMQIGFGNYFRRIYGYDVSFWGFYSPGFGVIAPFLSGILSIIGYVISKVSPKQPREVIIPMKQEYLKTENGYTVPSQVDTDLTRSSFKFCPLCGYEIQETGQRFCGNCGELFKNAASEIKYKHEIKPEGVTSEIEEKTELKLITIPPDVEEEQGIKEDCPNCNLSRKLGRLECIWCGKTL